MPKLTQARLKEALHYAPETGIFTWLNIGNRNDLEGKQAGYLTSNGYIGIMIDESSYQAHRLAVLYMTGLFPPEQTDHINHIRDDNRWINIRAVSHAGNAKNRTKYKANKSGITGVIWSKAGEKWFSYIRVKRIRINLGYFDNIDFAIAARKQAEIEHGFHENHGK